mmetsp:Transcript_34103/g.81422  ORF Transcript_34103/g.81422 Transcript_34103/m.81422 type:complete len:180 (-) Transcript_34103:1681-2220(-)
MDELCSSAAGSIGSPPLSGSSVGCAIAAVGSSTPGVPLSPAAAGAEHAARGMGAAVGEPPGEASACPGDAHELGEAAVESNVFCMHSSLLLRRSAGESASTGKSDDMDDMMSLLAASAESDERRLLSRLSASLPALPTDAALRRKWNPVMLELSDVFDTTLSPVSGSTGNLRESGDLPS